MEAPVCLTALAFDLGTHPSCMSFIHFCSCVCFVVWIRSFISFCCWKSGLAVWGHCEWRRLPWTLCDMLVCVCTHFGRVLGQSRGMVDFSVTPDTLLKRSRCHHECTRVPLPALGVVGLTFWPSWWMCVFPCGFGLLFLFETHPFMKRLSNSRLCFNWGLRFPALREFFLHRVELFPWLEVIQISLSRNSTDECKGKPQNGEGSEFRCLIINLSLYA